MNGKQDHERPSDTAARQAEMRRAVLSVQQERVALTGSFARLALDYGPSAVEALVVRMLRLQRAVAVAQHQVLVSVRK